MITLYEHPLSPYAQKVKISAREKGIELDLKTPDGVGVGNARGEFVDANPRAEVPALIDGNTRIFDSTIILRISGRQVSHASHAALHARGTRPPPHDRGSVRHAL